MTPPEIAGVSRELLAALETRPTWEQLATTFWRADASGWSFVVLCFEDRCDGTATKGALIIHLPPYLRELTRRVRRGP